MSGRQRNIRVKRATDEDIPEAGNSGAELGEVHRSKLQETKLMQKMRKKAGGMDSDRLAAAGPIASQDLLEEEEEEDKQFNSLNLMDSYVKATTVRETDEDEHMAKYVEQELAKRLGKRAVEEQLDESEIRRRKIDADLYSIPDHLQSITQEVPISGQMTAITEVAVSMEDRLRKIEETEAVKRRMLAAASRRAHLPMEDERKASTTEAKMKRSAVPVVFGKAEVRRCDRDPNDQESFRRRVVTEKRPAFGSKGSSQGGGKGKGR